jgi:hypothetical protein
MTEEQKLKKEGLKIINDWVKGGSHAHNVVNAALMAMAKKSPSYATRIYKELQDEHGY